MIHTDAGLISCRRPLRKSSEGLLACRWLDSQRLEPGQSIKLCQHRVAKEKAITKVMVIYRGQFLSGLRWK